MYASQPYPYPPPQSTGSRSATTTVVGILAIAFGSLVALYDTAQILGQAIDLAESPAPFLGGMNAEMQQAAPALIVDASVMFVMSAVLGVAGVGLVRQRQWGRGLAIFWCFVAFGVLPGRAVLWELAVRPHVERAAALAAAAIAGAIPALSGLQMSLGSGRSREYVTLFLFAVFPVLMLVLLSQRGVKQRLVSWSHAQRRH